MAWKISYCTKWQMIMPSYIKPSRRQTLLNAKHEFPCIYTYMGSQYQYHFVSVGCPRHSTTLKTTRVVMMTQRGTGGGGEMRVMLGRKLALYWYNHVPQCGCSSPKGDLITRIPKLCTASQPTSICQMCTHTHTHIHSHTYFSDPERSGDKSSRFGEM